MSLCRNQLGLGLFLKENCSVALYTKSQSKRAYKRGPKYRWKYGWQKPGSKERQILEQLTAPVLHPRLKFKPMAEECAAKLEGGNEIVSHPYRDFLVSKCREYLTSVPFLGIFQTGSIKMRDFNEMKVQFMENGFRLGTFGNHIVRDALRETKFSNLDILWEPPLFTSFVQDNDVRPKLFLRIARTQPSMLLLGVYMCNRLLSGEEFLKIAAKPEILDHQAELCSLLTQTVSQTGSLPLQGTVMPLVSNLRSHEENIRPKVSDK